MQHHLRTTAAAIALSDTLKKDVRSVYDFTEQKHRMISVRRSTNGRIQAFDFDKQAHVGGALPSLYHFGDNAHFQLRDTGGRYAGFDFASSTHFQITVSGRRATLFDFGDSSWHHFTA